MTVIAASRHDITRVIPEIDDDPTSEALPDWIDEATMVELWRRMMLLRTYDERSLVYHRHGRIGTYAISWGHEAMQAGAVSAMADDDWVVPSYRESLVPMLRGMDPSTVLAWWRGHPEGWWDPPEWKVASVAVPVASQVPHATGIAWGEKLQGRNTGVLCFFGDGATSEGDFHEGANFAAVLELPVVLFCNNNGWAITTPLSKQTRAEALVDKAAGYGIRGVRVDGNDVLAVWQAVREAVEVGKDEGVPTLVEAISWRPHLHATADDPTRYRDESEAEEWKRRDCLSRYERFLLAHGVIDESQVEATRKEMLDLMAEAIKAAEALPPASPEAIFDYAYAERLPAYENDLAELRAAKGAF